MIFTKFQFLLHVSGPDWSEKTLRVKFEKQLREQNSTRCYNSSASSGSQSGKANICSFVQIDGVTYKNDCDAAAALHVSRRTIQRRIDANTPWL